MVRKHISIIKDHLEEANETYWEHFYCSSKYALLFLSLFFTSFLHAVLPCFFLTRAKDTVTRIKSEIADRKEC
jgi:hypothetical protein